jgi:gp16 family phage-associated protein
MATRKIVATDPASCVETKQEISSVNWQVFRARGQSVADWAREHGFNSKLVYQVLAGQRKCLRGESYQIAKALNMKP